MATPNWDESQHPRVPAGSPEGGQFTSGGGAGVGMFSGTRALRAVVEAHREQQVPNWEHPEPNWAESVGEPKGELAHVSESLFKQTFDAEGVTSEEVLDEMEPKLPGLHDMVQAAELKMSFTDKTDELIDKGGFRNTDQTWQQDRILAHEKIADALLSDERCMNALPKEGEPPTVLVMGGRPAAGKTTFVKQAAPPDIKAEFDHSIHLDNDEIKSMLGDPKYWPTDVDTSRWPKYEGWNAGQFHEEATHVLAVVAERARARGINVTMDVTMNSVTTPQSLMKAFGDAGYEMDAIFIHSPPRASVERALERFWNGGQPGGRYVNAHYILGSRKNEANFDAVKGSVRHWMLIDHSTLGKYVTVASGTGTWDEDKHPRVAAGQPGGGQFAPKF